MRTRRRRRAIRRQRGFPSFARPGGLAGTAPSRLLAAMTSQLILLAHAPSAESHAAEVSVLLAKLGYEVSPLSGPRRARTQRIEAAHRVVLLWSREAARAPSLRVAARTARKAGKLACVRLDAAIPPARVSDDAQPLPRGRFAEQTWRRLLERTPVVAAAPQREAPHPTSRFAGVLATATLAFVIGAALYQIDAAFAARVDAMALTASAQASELADEIKARIARDT